MYGDVCPIVLSLESFLPHGFRAFSRRFRPKILTTHAHQHMRLTNRPFTRSHVHAPTAVSTTTRGESQLVRSSRGEGVSLREHLHRPRSARRSRGSNRRPSGYQSTNSTLPHYLFCSSRGGSSQPAPLEEVLHFLHL